MSPPPEHAAGPLETGPVEKATEKEFTKRIPRQWLRDNAADVIDVLGFLQRNPFHFNATLTLARLEQAPTVIRFGEDIAGRERVLEWLHTAIFGACAICYEPVICFVNGDKITWPDLERHECQPAAIPSSAPIARRPNVLPPPPADTSRGRPRNAGRP